MNPVFALARELQTPSAKFEASNALAREILDEIAASNRQDTLDMIQARVEADKAALDNLAVLNTRTTPRCPRGMHEFEYEVGQITLICHLDYEPAERGSRCDGLQQEPDYPAQMTLHAAYIGSIDVSGQLDDHVVADIEESALEGEQA